MPNDYRKSVLIGDADQERAGLLQQVIEHDFRVPVVYVETYDHVEGKVFEAREARSRWRLVLMAQDLPRSYGDPESILPDDFSHISRFSSVVRLGCIYSSASRPDLAGVGFAPVYIHIPQAGSDVDRREAIVENILSERHTGLNLTSRPPRIELDDDPILREQVRALSDTYDLEKAKELLAYLIRDFNMTDCNSVIVSRLVQGASGSKVFLYRPASENTNINERVLKATTHDNEWKLVEEVIRHLRAQSTLGNKYEHHVPEIDVIDPDAEAVPQHIASHEGWRAISYDFLGGKQFAKSGNRFGKFVDLETVIIGSQAELREKTRDTTFEAYFGEQGDCFKGRKRLLEVLLEWLCKNWYLNSAKRERKESLWNYSDGPDNGFIQFPPYRLAARTKRFIMSFLDGRKARMGERFFEDWQSRHGLVREFVAGGERELSQLYNLHHNHTVVLSPSHGDLNSNNILLWLDDAHPFLIDFPSYQESGHALQDFACLEVEIKFMLMDRQEESPTDRLPAFDYTHSQISSWTKLEECLLRDSKSEGCLALPNGGFEENVRLSYDLVLSVRNKARIVQSQKLTGKRSPRFWGEYRPALLYHTLRTIGYDSLSPFKRLLAVYSAAELLSQTRVKQ